MASTAHDIKSRKSTHLDLAVWAFIAAGLSVLGIISVLGGDQEGAVVGVIAFVGSMPFWVAVGRLIESLSLGYYKKYDQG
jgi:hypothetical protein